MNKKQEIFMCVIGWDIERFLVFAKEDFEASQIPEKEINEWVEYIKMRIATDWYIDENKVSLNEKYPEPLSNEDLRELAIAFAAYHLRYERHRKNTLLKLTKITHKVNITHG